MSLTNFRFVGLLAPVLLAGRFEYVDSGGLLDRGHLRWFTCSSLEDALRSAGSTPKRWSGDSGTGIRSFANRVTSGVVAELLWHQLYVSAINPSSGRLSGDGG